MLRIDPCEFWNTSIDSFIAINDTSYSTHPFHICSDGPLNSGAKVENIGVHVDMFVV